MSESGYVNLLQSTIDGSLYLGSTNNVSRRLEEHNRGKSAATKSKRPWTIMRVFRFDTLMRARQVERMLKSQKTKWSFEWIEKAIDDIQQ